MVDNRIFVYGDTHGDTHEHLRLIDIAADRGIKKMYQMGDCGFFPKFRETWIGIDLVQTALAKANITDHWIRGNHDDPDEWDHITDYYPKSKNGWGILRENIFLAPRVHYFKVNGLRFLGVGGAVSIDRQWRMSAEKEPNSLWFPNEVISDEDVSRVKDHKIDVLFTHECSNHTNFNGAIKADPDSEFNRMQLDKIIKRARPDFHFHGHMHRKFEWENYLIHGAQFSTKTYGLECNPKAMRANAMSGFGQRHFVNDADYENWGVFYTDTRTFKWRDQ